MARQGTGPKTSGRMAIDCICHHPCIEMGYVEQGSGEALVLIHGLGANADSWRLQREALAKNYRVVAMDLRGHGRSGFRVEEPLTLRALAADVMALLAGRGIEQAHFCGSSMGGMVALEIYVRHSLRVKSLISAAPRPFSRRPRGCRNFSGILTAWR
jgi:3-oxoadipate enol-lactonase